MFHCISYTTSLIRDIYDRIPPRQQTLMHKGMMVRLMNSRLGPGVADEDIEPLIFAVATLKMMLEKDWTQMGDASGLMFMPKMVRSPSPVSMSACMNVLTICSYCSA